MERDNADESNHIESSIHRRDFGDNPTNVITVNDRREPTFHPPKRPQPARCRLYPFCKARPCRLSSHQLYKREKVPPLGSGKRSMARAGGHGNQVAKMNSPLASIGNPGIDPFIQYPFELTGEMQELLKLAHYPLGCTYKGPQRHLFPRSQVSTLLGHVIHDSGCFQGYLAAMATVVVLAKAKDHGVALSQHGRAIRFLISACRDNEFAATDNTIMTAAFVACNELAFGNIDAADRNLRGIKHLVKVRGGLHNLGMGGVLATIVSGVDQYVAILKNTIPTYHMSLPPITLDLPSHEPRLGRGFREFVSKPSLVLDPQIVQAAVDFSKLMDIYEKGARSIATPAELTYFEYLQAAVENQLTLANARFHDTSTESECVCLAMLLCNSLACRSFGAVIPIHHMLASRLWRSIYLISVSTHKVCNEERARFGIWLVLISLSTALDGECPHASDALALLQVTGKDTSVHGWEELKKTVLDTYVWSEVAQGELFHNIWQEVLSTDKPEPTEDVTTDQDVEASNLSHKGLNDNQIATPLIMQPW